MLSETQVGLNVIKADQPDILETTFSPSVDLTSLGSSSNSSHIVALLDLDAPGGINGNKSYTPVLHWMTFVPVGQSTVQANASFANDIAPYGNPQPAPGTGMHRLLFLCYAGAPVADFVMPQSFTDFNATDITARVMFDIGGFTKDAAVSLVAANWFQTENTSSSTASNSTPEVVQESSGHKDSAQNALIMLTAVLGMFAFAI